LLFTLTADLDGVRDALVARRTAAWLGDDIWGAEEHLQGIWNGAIFVETPAIAARPAPTVRVRNTSAIPMRIVVRRAPDWLTFAPAQLASQAEIVLRPALAATAPPGEHHVELELEVLNLHVGPGRNLAVTVPLTIRVSGS